MICSLDNYAQLSNSFNIVFEPNQTSISDKQKTNIINAAKRLPIGVRATFYPLAYDSINDIYRFTNLASEQAKAIAEYASTVGFKLIGMPHNFPSSYSGMSVSVVMQYIQKIQLDTAITTVEQPLQNTPITSYFTPKPSQFFVINPLRDTVLFGNEGTKMVFRAGSLISKKPVQIELKEFYAMSDYIKNGLQTTSNGRFIQTGGSIYLNARENDAAKKQVQVNQNIGIGLDFTIGKNDTAMQIFIKDPKTPNEINWILPKKRTITQKWEMVETVLDANGKVISQKSYNKEEWAQKLKEDEEKKKAQEIENARIAKELEEEKKAIAIKENTSDLMDTKLNTVDLGYINCDRFTNETVKSIALDADAKIPGEYYIVYSDIRGVMKGQSNDKKVVFNSISATKTAIIIGVSFIGKQAYFFKTLFINGKLSNEKIELKPIDESKLNEELKLLN
jgi:hypothetical protein